MAGRPLARPAPGLGLTIAHLLAQVMGGEITVESEVGRGTRFRLRLMLASVARPQAASWPPAGAPARAYAGARRTILVADDDAAHRGLMRDILEPLGLVVLEAGDGPACLALAADAAARPVPPRHRHAGHERLGAGQGPARGRATPARIAMMSANVHEISPVARRRRPPRRDHRQALRPARLPGMRHRAPRPRLDRRRTRRPRGRRPGAAAPAPPRRSMSPSCCASAASATSAASRPSSPRWRPSADGADRLRRADARPRRRPSTCAATSSGRLRGRSPMAGGRRRWLSRSATSSSSSTIPPRP